MPTRLCLTPGCPDRATHRGRCKAHQKPRVYADPRWKRVRLHRLALNPICQECEQELATQVDHRIPVSAGGQPFALDNTRALCSECHSTKSHSERQ